MVRTFVRFIIFKFFASIAFSILGIFANFASNNKFLIDYRFRFELISEIKISIYRSIVLVRNRAIMFTPDSKLVL